tara:strand:+ start:45 stop:287 length:243 start_codon:yes stop_codon:yes gene_type:complete
MKGVIVVKCCGTFTGGGNWLFAAVPNGIVNALKPTFEQCRVGGRGFGNENNVQLYWKGEVFLHVCQNIACGSAIFSRCKY